MKNWNEIAGDLLIELAGAAIVATITWFATTTSGITGIPTAVVVTLAASVGITVALGVAYVIRTRLVHRMQKELSAAQSSSKNARTELIALRDQNLSVANQL